MDQKNPFLEELKQPDNLATLLVLAGSLAQGNNNPGTVAQKVAGAAMFRGEMDNVRDARTRQAAQDQLNEDSKRSEIQARQDSAEIARQDVGVRQRQVAVDEAGLESTNRLRISQANYYDRLPQEQRNQLDIARLNWQTERSKFYQGLVLEAQKGLNEQMKSVLADPMLDDAKRNARLAQINAHFARSTEAIAQLRGLEEQTGEMGYLVANPDGTLAVRHRLYRDPVAAAGAGTLAAVPPPGEPPPVAPKPAAKPEKAEDALRGVEQDVAAENTRRQEELAAVRRHQVGVNDEYEKIKNKPLDVLEAMKKRKNLDPATREAVNRALRERLPRARSGGGIG